MHCIYCNNGIAKVTNTRMIGNRVLRRRKCQACKKTFVTEELGYVADEKKGSDIAHDMQVVEYEMMKKRVIGISNRKPVTTSKPVTKRKGAPKPSARVEGEIYLTYSEIFEKFKEQYPDLGINDWRPYPLLDHSIIVWLEPSGLELAYQYWPKWDNFCLIERAKKYKQILEEAERRKL